MRFRSEAPYRPHRQRLRLQPLSAAGSRNRFRLSRLKGANEAANRRLRLDRGRHPARRIQRLCIVLWCSNLTFGHSIRRRWNEEPGLRIARWGYLVGIGSSLWLTYDSIAHPALQGPRHWSESISLRNVGAAMYALTWAACTVLVLFMAADQWFIFRAQARARLITGRWIASITAVACAAGYTILSVLAR